MSLVWLAFLWNLGSTGLVDETEPLFAEAARQMTVTGDWITPYFNGETRFDKPILIYWCMAVFYQWIGVNEWAVRLPSALSAIALTGLGFYTLRYFGFASPTAANSETKNSQRQLWLSAWLGAALMAINLETMVWGRTGVSDMLLSSCMGMALFCFFLGYAEEGKRKKQRGKSKEEKFNYVKSLFLIANGWYLAFYIFLSLAVLTKGPVGFVLLGLIIVTFLFYVGKFKEVFGEMGAIAGGFIFLLLTCPWYILVILKNGQDYINSFFGYHNFDRFTEVVNGHTEPWYFYFLVLLVGFIPWSVYLPLAIARLRFWRRSFWCKQSRSAQLGLFAFFWFIVVFVFFTIAVTKLPSYILPLFPAASILVALLWSEEITAPSSQNLTEIDRPKKKKNYSLFISIIFNILLLIILAVTIAYSPNLVGYDPAAPNLSEVLARSGLPWRGGIIWGVTALALIYLIKVRYRWQWIIAVNLAGFFAFIIFVTTPAFFLVDKYRQLPLRELSTLIDRVQKPDEQLLMVGFKKPSIVFYTQRRVMFFNYPEKAIEYLQEITQNKLSPSSVLIISQNRYLKKIDLESAQERRWENGSYKLIRVDPEKIKNK